MPDFETSVKIVHHGMTTMDRLMKANITLMVRLLENGHMSRMLVRSALEGNVLVLLSCVTNAEVGRIEGGSVRRNSFYDGLVVDTKDGAKVQWVR